jgi:hypothetical protein
MYEVRVNTSPLISHPAGPFYLDFQLNDGAGIGNADNTAWLSNFTFGGGSAVGSATAFGGVTGNLTSGITLRDTTAFNEFFQGFTAGSWLSFDLILTTKVDTPTPDLFSFAILDSTLSNLPTLAPFTDSFLSIDITGRNALADTFAGNGAIAPTAGGSPIALPAPTFVAVPEPSAYALFGAIMLLGIVAPRLWRKTKTITLVA